MGIGAKDTVAVFARNSHHSYAAMMGAVMEGITLATMVPTANEGASVRPLPLCWMLAESPPIGNEIRHVRY